MMPTIRPLGDSAAIVHWGDSDNLGTCRSVRQLADALNREAGSDFTYRFKTIVPAFTSITVHFCLSRMSFQDASLMIEQALNRTENCPPVTPKRIEIPVCFDAFFAPDLADVIQEHGVGQEEFIRRFCGVEYSVRMIGFSPGFPYLSGLPKELATRRQDSPRLKVPQGSVAIGGSQTGIYPQETPGGWNIIGRTPVRLFRAELARPCLMTAGDSVSFLPIHVDQFDRWQDEQ